MNPARRGSCGSCRHFNGRPLDIEAALPGLSSLSSAYAAVRSDDGICAMHDRYVAASSACAVYAAPVDSEALTALRSQPSNHRTWEPAPYR